MSEDSISRRAAIDAVDNYIGTFDAIDANFLDGLKTAKKLMMQLPSAQPGISRIEQELHGKTPEEQYEFLYWLLLKFGRAYTDSRLAVIEWLKGEK